MRPKAEWDVACIFHYHAFVLLYHTYKMCPLPAPKMQQSCYYAKLTVIQKALGTKQAVTC